MDKFGIFKLLSALNDSSSAKNDGNNPLQTILNSLSTAGDASKPTAEEPSKEQPAQEKKRLTSPLLDAMKNHDEFVKRVNKNNPR